MSFELLEALCSVIAFFFLIENQGWFNAPQQDCLNISNMFLLHPIHGKGLNHFVKPFAMQMLPKSALDPPTSLCPGLANIHRKLSVIIQDIDTAQFSRNTINVPCIEAKMLAKMCHDLRASLWSPLLPHFPIHLPTSCLTASSVGSILMASPAARIADFTSFSPLPVTTTTTVSSAPIMPSRAAFAKPA